MERKRILVTGGLGKLGKPLLAALLGKGHAVRTLHLNGMPVPGDSDERVEVVSGDILNPASLLEACRDRNVVYHLAGILQARRKSDFLRVNHGGTRNLVNACERAGVAHLIYISSISVTYPRLSDYAQSKAAGEGEVRNSKLPAWTLVRPTLIYDDEGGAQEFASLVKYVRRFARVPLPTGGRAMKRPIHSDDAATLLCLLAGDARAFAKTYALAGGEALSLRDMVTRIAGTMHLQRRVIGIPGWVARVGAALADRGFPGTSAGKQGLLGLMEDANPDIDPLIRDFGYTPRGFAPKEAALWKAAKRG